MTKTIELVDKDIKAVVINMFYMFKKLEKSIVKVDKKYIKIKLNFWRCKLLGLN